MAYQKIPDASGKVGELTKRSSRSRNMAAIRSKDTGPELIVRSLVHRMGYRFRLHAKDLPGKPDLVFLSRRKVIFVHGCFWHQHAKSTCSDSRRPKSNAGYWQAKLDRNVERDKLHLHALKKMNWKVLVIWDCETKNLDLLARRIERFLRHRQTPTPAISTRGRGK